MSSEQTTAAPDPVREEQLRIQALGAAISRRDWHAAEQAHAAIRDEFDNHDRAMQEAMSAQGGEEAARSLDAEDVIRDLAALPCETTSADDMETGCCRTCRARSIAKTLAAPAEAVRGVLWEVEEYKVWKGIDPNKPRWSGLNIICQSYDEANGMLEYISSNSPEKVFRVARSTLSLATPQEGVPAADTGQSVEPKAGTIWKRKHQIVTVCASLGPGVAYVFDGGNGEMTRDRFMQEYEPSTAPATHAPAAASEELVERLRGLQVHIEALGVGCCTCGTKSRDAHWHAVECKAHNLAHALDNLDVIDDLIEAGAAEMERLRVSLAASEAKGAEAFRLAVHHQARATAAEVERDALRAAVAKARAAFIVEYTADGRVSSVGHHSDALRPLVAMLDTALRPDGATEGGRADVR